MGELFQHQVNGNARPLDYRLSRQNPWVCDNALLVQLLFFFHSQVIIAYRGKCRIPVGVRSQLVYWALAITQVAPYKVSRDSRNYLDWRQSQREPLSVQSPAR